MKDGENTEKIKIEPTGSYFDIDSNGYLINPTSLEKVQPEWKPVVDEIINVYKKQFGEKLASVYIRGSVAKGQAVKNVSDIDTFSYLNLPNDYEPGDSKWAKIAEFELVNKYPFVRGIEFYESPIGTAVDDTVMLNQSVCVFGSPVDVPKIKIVDCIRHLNKLDIRMSTFDRKMSQISDDDFEEIKNACVWFTKEALRTGFELTIPKTGRYTRDLYLCYKDVSEYYPEQEPLMYEVLDLALNPTTKKDKIVEIKNKFLEFIKKEYKN